MKIIDLIRSMISFDKMFCSINEFPIIIIMIMIINRDVNKAINETDYELFITRFLLMLIYILICIIFMLLCYLKLSWRFESLSRTFWGFGQVLLEQGEVGVFKNLGIFSKKYWIFIVEVIRFFGKNNLIWRKF